MAFTNSPLVSKVHLSTKYNVRTEKISKITIHHAAGVISFENLLNYVATVGRDMSANYVLSGGKLGLVVEEKNRAWTSSSAWNDQRAVTIEVANSSKGGNWPISDADLNMLIKWCADVCKRNGIPKLYYDGTKNGTLTFHEMFANTNCPGPYIKSKANYICNEVNKLIGVKSATTASTKPSASYASSASIGKQYHVVTSVYGYISASDAVSDKNRKVTVKPGTYYIYNETSTAVNVTKTKSSPGAWIAKSKNVTASTSSKPQTSIRYDWKKGQAVKLTKQKTQLFANDSTATPAAMLSPGTYYIYDGIKCGLGRFRITTKAENCGKTPVGKYVTGFVSADNFS